MYFILHACGSKNVHFMKFHQLLMTLACKVESIIRKRKKKVAFACDFIDLGFASNQFLHLTLTFQLFIPNYDYCMVRQLKFM